MAKPFTVLIKGISISYIKNVGKEDVWRVLFPFDEETSGGLNKCHNVRLKLDQYDEGIILGREGLKGLRIDIFPKGEITSETEQGNDYEDFVDLTGSYTHGSIKTRYDDLTFEELDGVIMTIPNAELSVDEHSGHLFGIRRYGGGTTTRLPQDIGLSAKAIIYCEDVDVVVTSPTKSFTINLKAGSTVIFDNDCPGATLNPPADFTMVYQLLEDGSGMGDRYEIYGTETIPCNMVRISKPSELLP